MGGSHRLGRWLVIAGLVALGARCDCGGSCFDFGLGYKPAKKGQPCSFGCGGPACEDSLECCMTESTRGSGQIFCAGGSDCVPGARGDPCNTWAGSAPCDSPYSCERLSACEGYCPAVCACHNPCDDDHLAPYTCAADEQTCTFVCCAVFCGDAGACPAPLDAGLPDGGDAGDDAGLDAAEADAEAPDSEVPDGGDGADDAAAATDA